MAEFISAGGQVRYGTLGPGDIVVDPHGWVFAERSHNSDDVVGYRCGLLHHGPGSIDLLETVKADQELSGKPGAATAAAIKVLLTKVTPEEARRQCQTLNFNSIGSSSDLVTSTQGYKHNITFIQQYTS